MNPLDVKLSTPLFDIEKFHPDIEIETLSIQVDHIHLVIVIPPKYAVSDIVRKIKANTSREMRQRFPWIKKIYWRNEFWSVGFFSSLTGSVGFFSSFSSGSPFFSSPIPRYGASCQWPCSADQTRLLEALSPRMRTTMPPMPSTSTTARRELLP